LAAGGKGFCILPLALAKYAPPPARNSRKAERIIPKAATASDALALSVLEKYIGAATATRIASMMSTTINSIMVKPSLLDFITSSFLTIVIFFYIKFSRLFS
jgi:hypothetical protein